VLYLDPQTGALTAYDEITLGGLGQTEVTIQRQVVSAAIPAVGDGAVPAPATPAPTPVPAPASPTG
jgi:hypothetical protein